MATRRRTKRPAPPAKGTAREVVDTAGDLLRVLAIVARARKGLGPRPDDANELATVIGGDDTLQSAVEELRTTAHRVTSHVRALTMQVRIARACKAIAWESACRFGDKRPRAPEQDELEDFAEWVRSTCREFGLTSATGDPLTAGMAVDIARSCAPRASKTSVGGRPKTREARVAEALCIACGVELMASTILQVASMVAKRRPRSGGRLHRADDAERWERFEFDYVARDALELAIRSTLGARWNPRDDAISKATDAAWRSLFEEAPNATPRPRRRGAR